MSTPFLASFLTVAKDANTKENKSNIPDLTAIIGKHAATIKTVHIMHILADVTAGRKYTATERKAFATMYAALTGTTKETATLRFGTLSNDPTILAARKRDALTAIKALADGK